MSGEVSVVLCGWLYIYVEKVIWEVVWYILWYNLNWVFEDDVYGWFDLVFDGLLVFELIGFVVYFNLYVESDVLVVKLFVLIVFGVFDVY